MNGPWDLSRDAAIERRTWSGLASLLESIAVHLWRGLVCVRACLRVLVCAHVSVSAFVCVPVRVEWSGCRGSVCVCVIIIFSVRTWQPDSSVRRSMSSNRQRSKPYVNPVDDTLIPSYHAVPSFRSAIPPALPLRCAVSPRDTSDGNSAVLVSGTGTVSCSGTTTFSRLLCVVPCCVRRCVCYPPSVPFFYFFPASLIL